MSLPKSAPKKVLSRLLLDFPMLAGQLEARHAADFLTVGKVEAP